MKTYIFFLIFAMAFYHSCCNVNFIQQVWKTIQAEGIPSQAIDTLFIKGIIKGDMNPDCYLNFGMQDAFYLYKSARLWQNTCQKVPDSLKQFCANQAKSYREFADYFGKKVARVQQNGPIANQASQSYVTQQENYVNQKAINILLTNYACYKLWPWIANNIKDKAQKKNNVYYKWITDNQSDQAAIRLQNEINKYYQQDFKQIAYDIVKTLVNHQVSFFNGLCEGQKNAEKNQEHVLQMLAGL